MNHYILLVESFSANPEWIAFVAACSVSQTEIIQNPGAINYASSVAPVGALRKHTKVPNSLIITGSEHI